MGYMEEWDRQAAADIAAMVEKKRLRAERKAAREKAKAAIPAPAPLETPKEPPQEPPKAPEKPKEEPKPENDLQLPPNKKILYQPHPGPQTEFHAREEDFVLYGGAKGGGKSQALLFEATKQIGRPGYRAIILRRTFPRLQELIDRAKEFYPKLGGKWEGEAKRFRFRSGATIAFGHCEHEDDKYNYQGHEFGFMGFDQLEEFTESQFRFLRAQNRCSFPDVVCYVRATANPGNIGHWWIKRMFIDGCKPEKKYEQVFDLPNGGRVSQTWSYIPSTVYDNPTLLKAQPNYLANLMSLPEVEREALLKGNWNAFASDCVFDARGMSDLQKLIVDPLRVGFVRDEGDHVDFVPDDRGKLVIWDFPRVNSRYIVTADVAKGVEGGDNSAAIVWDGFRKEAVARWHGKVDPMEFGRILQGIGYFYNHALLCVEVWPGPGITTGAKIVEDRYPRVYRRRVWDGSRREDKEETGWVTDSRSRYEMIATLQQYVRDRKILIRDSLTIDELYNFTRTEKGRLEARSGAHDDLVICCGMAVYIFEHVPIRETHAKNADKAIVVSGGSRLPKSKSHAINGAFRRMNPGFV